MDIVYRPDGNFDEVYLYVRFIIVDFWLAFLMSAQEELMEADLHAIVRLVFV